MEELQNKFAQIQQEFQEQMVGEMTKEFQRVVHNMLTISQSQEKLQKNTKRYIFNKDCFSYHFLK